MADDKLIFPIGFDLEEGVKQAGREWKNHYRKRLQDAIDSRPLKVKIDFESKGIDTKEFKQWMVLAREAEKIERERIKNAKEWQKVADQAAMAETRRANATNESNARIERANRRAEASERRKAKAVQDTGRAYATQSGYLQRLIQRMGVYFGLHQAMSFIRNIREVTAEFELQRVALGSIIGDLNEANKMFEQIKAAAVKSPFQIKELVSYTKQLAAYKIEQDELFETTQRLADISAGLGVGMERLVLAYGQIRATGYLRASEVRQLTEAGIPIVEELAKKMSQLRGETVSAAEVMGLISERAISFGMVKEVFDDMTSAGGMFYKMQEKQAETLAGQWSNLRDSIAIMYEEIGNTEGVNNTMKGMIGLIKSLAENWRTLGVIMFVALDAFGAYKGVTKIFSFLTASMIKLDVASRAHIASLRKMALAHQRVGALGKVMALNLVWQTKLLKKAAQATNFWKASLLKLGAFLAGNVWNIALLGIGALVSWIVSAHVEANRLNKELERIGAEGDVQARTQVNNFERLAKVIRDSADGSLRQTEALKEMKRAYGEFLPSQDKEIINLVRAKEGYEAVSQAIREKIALQVQEQKINAVTSEYSKTISDYLPDLENLLKPEGIDVSRVYGVLKTAIEEGSLALTGSVKEDAEAINAILEKELGITLDLFGKGRLLTIKGWKDVFNSTRVMELLRPILNAETELRNAIQGIENELLSDTGITGIYAERWEQLQKDLRNITANGEVGSFEWNEDKTRQEIDLYHNFIKERIAEINKDLSDDKKIKFEIGDAIDFKALEDALGDSYPQLKVVIEKLRKEYEKIVPTDITRRVNDVIQDYAKQVGISMDDVKEHLKTNNQSTEDWAKGIEGSIETLKKRLNEYKENQKAFLEKGSPFRDWSEYIKGVEDEIKMLEFVMKALSSLFAPTTTTPKTNPRIAQLKEELSTVEKIYKEYESFRKGMSQEGAVRETLNLFKGVDLKYLQMATSPEKMRKALEDALRMAKMEGDKELALELQYKLGKFDADEAQRKLEKQLKTLSANLSRTKTAKEFFDRMLGLTGDRELSATLTLSVYGTTGDDLKKLMTQQVLDAFKELPEGFDLTKAMLGGNNWDYNVLADLVKHLPETQQKNAQSIVDNWRKTNADILYDLQKSYEDYMTYEERKTRVVEKYSAERKKIMESEYDDDEKKKLVKAANKLENKELTDIAIEEFKASEDWAKSFEDLENLATPTIERLMSKLKEFIDLNKEDFTPEQLKTLMQEYQKLYDGLISRKPFQAITDSIKEYRTAMQGIQLAKEQLSAAQAIGDEDLIAFAERELTNAFDDAQKATTKLQKGLGGLADKFSQAEQFVQSFTETLGISEDSDFGAFLNGMAESFGGVAKAIAFAQLAMQLFDGTTKTFLTSNPIGWILLIVSAIISAVQAIMNARVNRINKEIESLQDHLDNLEYSFERLQKAQEKAFGSDYISNYEQRMANLVAQQDAYLKQAELERSKGKKADEDKIKEYENAARDTADEIKDMQAELSEYFLGTDLTSAARDFANAWIDAYKEFGNTTDAMKEKFQDMIQNMIVESFAARVVQTALKDIFDSIDNMSKDGVLDMSEASKIADMTEVAVGNIDVGMTNLMNALSAAGISVRGMGSELTGISRDIATASEESILGLAAGINTQNFYISQVPPKLDVIIGLLQGGNPTQGSAITLQDLVTIQNQHLSYLPSIAQHTADTVAECKQIVAETRRTADALERVIKPRGVQSTHTLNTTLGS